MSVLYIRCVCSVQQVCLFCTTGVSVLYNRCVCSVQQVCLFCTSGVSVLYNRCVCSVHQVCLFCTAGVSVLYNRCVCSVQQVCLFCTTGAKGRQGIGVLHLPFLCYCRSTTDFIISFCLNIPLAKTNTRAISRVCCDRYQTVHCHYSPSVALIL
jgi:hypothetical protein